LRDLYVDSIVFTPEALRHLVAECGAGQIVMGTDYPYPWTGNVSDLLFAKFVAQIHIGLRTIQ
jgi:aminocarboxymuconate-semialdehyde decarboxylase